MNCVLCNESLPYISIRNKKKICPKCLKKRVDISNSKNNFVMVSKNPSINKKCTSCKGYLTRPKSNYWICQSCGAVYKKGFFELKDLPFRYQYGIGNKFSWEE